MNGKDIRSWKTDYARLNHWNHTDNFVNCEIGANIRTIEIRWKDAIQKFARNADTYKNNDAMGWIPLSNYTANYTLRKPMKRNEENFLF